MSFRLLWAVVCAALVSACGGGGDALPDSADSPDGLSEAAAAPVQPVPSDLWRPAKGRTPSRGNYAYLQSDAKDPLGEGETRLYTGANAEISVRARGSHLVISIDGRERWKGDFSAAAGEPKLRPGYYRNLRRYPNPDPARGGLYWRGDGRRCDSIKGWFVLDKVSYAGTKLRSIEIRFGQRCDGAKGAMHGRLRWNANDAADPVGPTYPLPQNLWKPARDATPKRGNYVYLDSDAHDFVGGGASHLYTRKNALLKLEANGGLISVTVNGDQSWTGSFKAMTGLHHLEPGYYGPAQRYPFQPPSATGLEWSGDGRGCNTLSGWFVVDDVDYAGDTLMAIELRFEQHCEGGSSALRGKIRWDRSDTDAPPGPIDPPPGDLWAPAADAVPPTGSYVYLESDLNDYIGDGRSYTYTRADAVLTVAAAPGGIVVNVAGDEEWDANFQAMNTLTKLRPGYYGDLQRFPFHNPVKGGLSWHGEGRGCNTLKGWFVVDSVAYSGSRLTAVDLRFEQHCEDYAPALRGRIRWDAGDATTPTGPQNPVPSDLWRPAVGSTPATGSFVYLESDPNDYIGGGATALYQAPSLRVSGSAAQLSVSIEGDATWTGEFLAMTGLGRLQPGYYGGLQRYPFHNPAKGGLDWSGEGRGCNTLTGWFVVDEVAYNGSKLVSIDLRFEQHCEGAAAALRGRVRLAP